MISIIFISVFEYSRTVKILISIEMHNKHNILQVMCPAYLLPDNYLPFFSCFKKCEISGQLFAVPLLAAVMINQSQILAE